MIKLNIIVLSIILGLVPCVAYSEGEVPWANIDRTKQFEAYVSLPEVFKLGRSNSKLKLVVAHDTSCGMCRYFFRENLVSLKEKYIESGILQLVVVEYPLFRPSPASTAARALICAGEQNSYFIMFAHMYKESTVAAEGELSRVAKTLGLDLQRFEECLSSKRPDAVLDRILKIGENPIIDGTPTILLNGKQIGGAMPWFMLEDSIQKELKASNQ